MLTRHQVARITQPATISRAQLEHAQQQLKQAELLVADVRDTLLAIGGLIDDVRVLNGITLMLSEELYVVSKMTPQ